MPRRLTTKKVDQVLFALLYCLDSEDLRPDARRALVDAGDLVDRVRGQASDAANTPHTPWRETVARHNLAERPRTG